MHILIRGGAGVERRDYKGWTPLIIACNMGMVDVVDVLCADYHANVNYTPATQQSHGPST